MDVYKAKIQYDGSPDNIKLRIVVRGDLQTKELFGDTWSQKASMRTLKYFFANATKNKARIHHLDSIGEFLQAKVKNRVFVKLDIRYILLSIIFKVLWKSLDVIEVHVWHD